MNKAAATKIEAIAKEILDLETLETRHGDSLDFHDLAVWQLKAALEAAYKAGAESAKRYYEEGFEFNKKAAMVKAAVRRIARCASGIQGRIRGEVAA